MSAPVKYKVGQLFDYIDEDDSIVVAIDKRWYGTTVDLYLIESGTYVYSLGV